MSGGGEAGLVVQGLEVRYRGALALSSIDLRLPPGGRTAIVGRNGAGKSSLLRAIAGVVPASGGRIVWAGRDVSGDAASTRVRRGISLVPEGRRVFGELTVNGNLRVGAFCAPRSLAERRERVFDLFPALGERADLPASQLSGGEAQMLAIGQALMAGPRLLLLDEPSLGLAPLVVTTLLDTIRRLSDEGLTILLVEQSVRLALSLAEDLYVLESGTLAAAARKGEHFDEAAVQAAYLGAHTEPDPERRAPGALREGSR